MMLADTNIFLEILLGQQKQQACEQFLLSQMGHIVLSDFSLHSMGVILFRHQAHQTFEVFCQDVLPNVSLQMLPAHQYPMVAQHAKTYKLDFDDAYQTTLADHMGFSIATMDQDFRRVSGLISVVFL